MIVDTSILIAVLKQEPEARRFFETIVASVSKPKLSAGNYLEAQTVIAHGDYADAERLKALVTEMGATVMAVDVEQAELGGDAYRTFGKASTSKAKLNFGDCFAYALAKATGEPLLFKDDDFVHTDIAAA